MATATGPARRTASTKDVVVWRGSDVGSERDVVALMTAGAAEAAPEQSVPAGGVTDDGVTDQPTV